MTKKQNVASTIAELLTYAELSDDEWGESMLSLCAMWDARSTLSTPFLKALEKEITGNLKWAQGALVIVEREHTEITTHKIKELEFKWMTQLQ